MKRQLRVFYIFLGIIISASLTTSAFAFEVLLETETVTIAGVRTDLVRTANNFIVLFGSFRSMGETYKDTGMRKLDVAKEFLRERNAMLPELNYQAGLYSYTTKRSAKEALEVYYPMKRYNKAEFAKAIDRLPAETGGLTLMQNAFRELGPILDKLSGRTVVFLFTDGQYSQYKGRRPVDFAREYAQKYDVHFYVISTAKRDVEKEMVKAVASINTYSRVIPLDFFLGRPGYLSGALFVVEKTFFIASETTERLLGIKPDPILYNFDQDKINPEYHEKLSVLGKFLERNPQAYVLLAGFTDNMGDGEYNLGLSRRRSEGVGSYLSTNFNIGDEQIVLHWYGEAAPVASNDSAEGRRKNRRVGIIVTGLE